MKYPPHLVGTFSRLLSFFALAGVVAFSLPAIGAGLSVPLSGSQEVPPVTTAASGSGQINVSPDGVVSGSITLTGMTATAAHIHEGAAGNNGPVIIPLVKRSDTSFAVPDGTKFTAAQLAAYKAGNTYINVHSAAFPAGEVRGQLMPPKPGAGGPPAAY